MNKTDNRFPRLCAASGLPMPVREYKFSDTRRWRIDYAWPDHLIALEVEGGVWTGGRHFRGMGIIRDMEKYNTMAVTGWLLIRCTPQEMHNLSVMFWLKQAFDFRERGNHRRLLERSET